MNKKRLRIKTKKQPTEKKIRIKTVKTPKTPHIKPYGEITLPKIHINYRQWYLIMSVLILLSITSSISAINAYQQPDITTDTILDMEYVHVGTFSYTAELKNNTIYEKTILAPGDGTIFRKLLSEFTLSFSYTCDALQSIPITGNYRVLAILTTATWEKQYILIPVTSFESSTKEKTVTFTLPLNYSLYETIIQTINEETGTIAQEAMLQITPQIYISGKTTSQSFQDSFSPALTCPLQQNTIMFMENLTQVQKGELTYTVEKNNDESSNKQILAVSSIILIGMTVVSPVFLNKTTQVLDKESTELKKVLKKYKEWIVTVTRQPDPIGARSIPLQSIDDLVKISEELSKPILYYSTVENKKYTFYVVDESLMYTYLIH